MQGSVKKKKEIAEVFMSEGVSKEEIIKRGEESLLILFGSDAKALDEARAQKFHTKWQMLL